MSPNVRNRGISGLDLCNPRVELYEKTAATRTTLVQVIISGNLFLHVKGAFIINLIM